MIVPAGLAHAAAMAAIHAASFPPAQQWGADAVTLQLALPGSFGLIAEPGGMLLARALAGQAEILALCVIPAARRRGVGRALLDAALFEASRRGARSMFLEVSAANRPAGLLYLAAGFAEIGCRRRYYSDGTDALILRAMLSPPPPSAAPMRLSESPGE